MEITLATVGRRTGRKRPSAEELLTDYCERIARFCRCSIVNYATEDKFLTALGRGAGRKPTSQSRLSDARLILLTSRGRSLSTEQFAQWLQREREQSARSLLFAVGPADGWSEAALDRATSPALLLSLGPMTLPHELAAIVVAEQIYRAFTIIEGHPYHLGHA